MELGLNCLKTCVRSLYAINHIKNVHPTVTGVRFKSVKSAVLHELNTDLKIEDMKSPKKLKKEEVRVYLKYSIFVRNVSYLSNESCDMFETIKILLTVTTLIKIFTEHHS